MVDQAMEEGCGYREGSEQKILDTLLELLGKDGGDHLQFRDGSFFSGVNFNTRE
ncbi:MAG: hypothetical protein HYY20_04525 [Candidatus Tectomicrobia bacterium]|uniref:Uncharacterized protein n=1 Tax=Tectimicrobiota bacterium TaxID=2528274 RepID=A0A932CNC9_UNCTE|nr:hypothetical protein [Candidatus Tectomicrobia bacterium]